VVELRDASVAMRNGETGYIDSNAHGNNLFPTTNGDGCEIARVRVRDMRVPTTGDKLSSRHGQKGTVGVVMAQEDMPFTAEGLVPDIIINPHAIPSRMTGGQMMETLLGCACCATGTLGDGTMFNGVTVEGISATLRAHGLHGMGDVVMYDGRTGEQVHTAVFLGPVFYQRLKHMVCDKVHSRGASGPVVMLTRQPAEGRARDGGLRLGEMEVDCLWSHGVVQFLKERFQECSDDFVMHVCKKCCRAAVVNPEEGLSRCSHCVNTTSFARIRMPFAMRLFCMEVQACGLAVRLVTPP
jgi:DNA-directed RNA polymerase II subunit RPB2